MKSHRNKITVFAIILGMLTSTLYGCSLSEDVAVTSALVDKDTGSTSSATDTSDASAVSNTEDVASAQPKTAVDAAASSSEAAPSANSSDVQMKTIVYNKEDLDSSWSLDNGVTIDCDGTEVLIEGAGAAAENGSVTITKAGTYILSGELTKGTVSIDAGKDDVVRLVLNGISITSENSSAINGMQNEKIMITLAEGTSNILSDGSAYVYSDSSTDEPNAALFSKDDLVINGTGSLTVNGNYQDGIRSKDNLTIISGSLIVAAAKDGIQGKDSVVIKDGNIQITAGADGMVSSNDTDAGMGFICLESGTYRIISGNDGIQAQQVLQITGGSIYIEAGGTSSAASGQDTSGESSKGIKGNAAIYIASGNLNIDSFDDAIHSNGNISITDGSITLASGDDAIHADANLAISGGTLHISNSYEGLEGLSIDISGGSAYVTSSDDGVNAAGGNDSSSSNGPFGGDRFAANEAAYIHILGGYLYIDASGDGIDSNGDLDISGGTVLVCGPINSGNGALDYNGSGTISGGTLIAAGNAGMAQSLSETSTQASVLIYYDQLQSANTLLNLSDSSDTSILSFAPVKDYQCVLISTPALLTGSTYTLYSGGTSDGVGTDGYYDSSETYTQGTVIQEFSLDSITSTIGSGGQGNRQGGFPGGERRGMESKESTYLPTQ